MKQKLIELQGETDKSIIRGGDFNTITDWLSKKCLEKYGKFETANNLGILLKWRAWFTISGVGLEFCIFFHFTDI